MNLLTVCFMMYMIYDKCSKINFFSSIDNLNLENSKQMLSILEEHQKKEGSLSIHESLTTYFVKKRLVSNIKDKEESIESIKSVQK
ncbi:hypothetical protein [Lyticum sinuosum]|nr:hypothetical protein [Lyticum sinuosum]